MPLSVILPAIAGFISGTGSILTGLYNNKKSFSQTLALANQQFEFNKYLMQNRHQFEVADLRAAGLNPILSAGGSGAPGSTGSGGSFSSNINADLVSAIQLDNNLRTSASQRDLLKAQRDQVLSDVRKTNVSTAIDEQRLKQEILKTNYISRDPFFFTPSKSFWDIIRGSGFVPKSNNSTSANDLSPFGKSLVKFLKSAWDWNMRKTPIYNFYRYNHYNGSKNIEGSEFLKYGGRR